MSVSIIALCERLSKRNTIILSFCQLSGGFNFFFGCGCMWCMSVCERGGKERARAREGGRFAFGSKIIKEGYNSKRNLG